MVWAMALLLAGTAFIFLLNESGVVLYLIVLIASITLFVSTLLAGNPYPQVKQDYLLFDKAFKKELVRIYEGKRIRHHMLILVSIILFCIGMFVLPLVGLEMVGEDGESMILALSMIIAGASVYLFVYFLGTLQSYRLLVKNEEKVERRK